MSKRWKKRKSNAAKLERSREVIDQFYDNVITSLEQMAERVRRESPHQPRAGCHCIQCAKS